MPWKEQTMLKQRLCLVEEIKSGERSISAICRTYDISRVTAYKWLKRSEAGISLDDISRKPLFSPNKTIEEIENIIVQARQEHPFWGGRKLKAYLERLGEINIPSASTVTAILHRHGLISKEASIKATPFKRFERANPNDLWQTDFKGHFKMLDGNRCHPLTVTDDCSRFNLCISAKDNERLPGVISTFRSLFEEYGLPRSILCDNGNPWGVGAYFGGYTKFEIFLMDYDIKPIHGRPLHPQTQGKEERFHRTLKRELLSVCEMKNISFAQKKFDNFRKDYNEIRPHCALNYAVPSDRYEKSKVKMPEIIYDWDYPSDFELRKIRNGYISFKGNNFYFSDGFEGKNVALLHSLQDNTLEIIYRNFSIAMINLNEKSFISKKIKRLKEENCAE